MSEPIVSSFDEKFMEAFGRGCDAIPSDQTKTIKKIIDQIHESVVSDLQYYIEEDLKQNMNHTIRDEASRVASSMLANALAGDDKEIRNLFGFNEWYMKHHFTFGTLPSQWALIDALVARRPDLFVSERIAQREAEISALQASVARQKEYIERLIEKLRGYGDV